MLSSDRAGVNDGARACSANVAMSPFSKIQMSPSLTIRRGRRDRGGGDDEWTGDRAPAGDRVVAERRLRQAAAARRLGLSVRQVKRLVRALRRQGPQGLVSRRRGRPSNRRIPAAVRARYLALVKRHYRDFGPTLAAEYLAERHGFPYSVETLRAWMGAAGLWTPKRARHTRPHPPRLRRPAIGELVQIDGSPHAWLEDRGPRATLIAFIDDATSRVLAARFVVVESSRAYLAVLKAYVQTHGCPVAVYSDRHSIFTKHDPEDPAPTQVERALEALGIEPIRANSPQAKGRIERVFQTFQDRLVKALRLAAIDSLEGANTFLCTYLPVHNARFGVAPAADADAHRPYAGTDVALARICALQHARRLSKNLVATFRGQRYIVTTPAAEPRYALRGRHITVCEHLDGTIELLHGAEALPYRVFDARADGPAARLADDKTLNDRVDAALERRRAPWKPAAEHPWRRGYRAVRPNRPRSG